MTYGCFNVNIYTLILLSNRANGRMGVCNMQNKQFQRTKENFICEHCGQNVRGNGYTNHCPRCLWSKHVDINPGDRQETCGGLMKPADVVQKHGKYILIHRCVACGFERANIVSPNDDFDVLLQIASKAVSSM